MKSVKDRLVSGTGWALVIRVGTMFTGILTNALLARILVPVEFGAVMLFITVITVASDFGQMGLGNTAVRVISESLLKDTRDYAVANVKLILGYAMLGSSLVSIILILGGWDWIGTKIFESEMLTQVSLLAAISVFLYSLQMVIGEIFRGFHDIRLASVFGGHSGGLFSKTLYAIFFGILWLLKKNSSVSEVLGYKVIADAISLLVSLLLLGKLANWFRTREQPIAKGLLFSFAVPFMITDVSRYFFGASDMWFLGAYRPLNEVAVYSATFRLIQFVVIPMALVNAVIPPMITELYLVGKKERLQRMLQTTAAIAGLPAAAVLLFFVFFGGDVLGLIYGDYYRSGHVVLVILSISQLFGIWAGACGVVLNMTGNQITMMRTIIFTGFLTVIGIWVVVAEYGQIGVACVTAATTIIQNILMLFFTKQKTGLWTFAAFDFSTLPSMLRRLMQKKR